jgi:hypothetical protein
LCAAGAELDVEVATELESSAIRDFHVDVVVWCFSTLAAAERFRTDTTTTLHGVAIARFAATLGKLAAAQSINGAAFEPDNCQQQEDQPLSSGSVELFDSWLSCRYGGGGSGGGGDGDVGWAALQQDGACPVSSLSSSSALVHFKAQWRPNAFERPVSVSDFEPCFDFGAACSSRADPLAHLEDVSATVTLSAASVVNAAASTGVGAPNTTTVPSDDGVPAVVLQRGFGPHHIAGASEAGLGFVGVPPSAVFTFESGTDQQTRFFVDSYKNDPLLFDEALGVRGACFTAPAACDAVLNIIGTGMDTERHAL